MLDTCAMGSEGTWHSAGIWRLSKVLEPGSKVEDGGTALLTAVLPKWLLPEGQAHTELVKRSLLILKFGMMEGELFWLELVEDRWCHPLQVVPFQLALETLFLGFLQFGGVGGEGRGRWRSWRKWGRGDLVALRLTSKSCWAFTGWQARS